MPRTPQPRDAAVFGIDLGKNVFHVVSTDALGAVVQRTKFRRDTLLRFFECATPALMGWKPVRGRNGSLESLKLWGTPSGLCLRNSSSRI